jgi:hypothetical protein
MDICTAGLVQKFWGLSGSEGDVVLTGSIGSPVSTPVSSCNATTREGEGCDKYLLFDQTQSIKRTGHFTESSFSRRYR